MKEIVKIKINGKLFRLELEQDLAEFFIADLNESLNKDNNSVKDLLNAYIKKTIEQFNLAKKVEELTIKLS
ncbi:hypothetical protein ThvES_00004890 [Thiovulum sp. ES]|jgi:hypothetical protein|nr:hypothetical protein ThvES_00004890 [Thiovulum sp. ES]